MNPALVNGKMTQSAACRMARVAGAFYVINIVTSMYSYFGPRNRLAFIVGLVAAVAYVTVTVLFYFLFKPVNHSLSLLAACVSMAGSTLGVLGMFHVAPTKMNILVFFGFYCLLIGYLILRATFLPAFLGALMIFAGIGYLTYLWPPLSKTLYPYNVIPGALGEWTLTVWLLVEAVNGQKWAEQPGIVRAAGA